MSRLALLLIVASAACSQRSPWTTIPAPASASRTSDATQQANPTHVALATAARLPSDEAEAAEAGTLEFPVAGYGEQPLADSFDDARDGGERQHNAIDIMAPRGTAVLSVQDGRILRLSRSSKGGITVYATDRDEQFVFYYAHLDRYHPRLYAGKPLLRGDTLGYVGTTGNAPENAPHLHFQMMRMPTDGKYWNGEPVNPYRLLRPNRAQ